MYDAHVSDKLGPTEPSEPEPDGPPDEVEELAEAYDFEENSRKWLRAIAPLLEAHDEETPRDARVQYALDMLVIAAAERGCRILRSDLPQIESSP